MKKKEQTNFVRISASDLKPPSAKEIQHLKDLPESEIDFSDIPETGGQNREGRRAVLISLRLERDLLEWFKKGGAGYQTRIRRALREHMRRHESGESNANEIADAVVQRLRAFEADDRKSSQLQQPKRRKSA